MPLLPHFPISIPSSDLMLYRIEEKLGFPVSEDFVSTVLDVAALLVRRRGDAEGVHAMLATHVASCCEIPLSWGYTSPLSFNLLSLSIHLINTVSFDFLSSSIGFSWMSSLICYCSLRTSLFVIIISFVSLPALNIHY